MTNSTTFSLTPQDALVALMIAVSASDEDIRTAELVKINSAVNNLPVFAGYDLDRLNVVAQTVHVHQTDEIYCKPNCYFMPINEISLGCFYASELNWTAP